ncbi:MAG: hypothetical protein NTY19_05470 [Planctomycetota bacterium]|nr:hypothetical protein [Planctomycetota bacterium]
MDETRKPGKPTEAEWQTLNGIIERANAGERKAIEELEFFLDQNPNVWQTVGDLAHTAERAWVDLISAKDRLFADAIRRKLAQLKEQVVGETASAVEQMLGDQIAVTLLETKYLETLNAKTTSVTLAQSALLLNRLSHF